MQARGHNEVGAGSIAIVVIALTPMAVSAAPGDGPSAGSREAVQELSRPMIGPNVLISAASPSQPHVEPHVAVHPEDRDRLHAASIVIDRRGEWRCAVYVSDDGGSKWRPSSGRALDDLGDCGDPWVAFGPSGRAYFSGLHADTAGGRRVERTVVLSSTDRGATWTARSAVPHGPGVSGGFDRPAIVVDRTGGPYAGTVLSGYRGVAISGDGGESFSDAARLSDHDRCVSPRSSGNVRGSFDVAGPWLAGGDYFGLAHRRDGEFVAVWSDSRRGTLQLWSAIVRTME